MIAPIEERHQHDDRDGADAHLVDLREDGGEVDAAAAAEFHLGAAIGRAEDVHRREEIVAHPRRRARRPLRGTAMKER